MPQHRGASGSSGVTNWQVEADGGSRGNPGPAAYGAVVINGGSVVRELAGALGVATNNVAEYNALLAALRWLGENTDGTDPVEVRMDSRLVVEQMSGNWRIKHPDMRTLAIAARDSYPPALVNYVWVPRLDNTRADALVNEVLDSGDSGVVIDRAP